jgi:Ca2+:H+ antiporter
LKVKAWLKHLGILNAMLIFVPLCPLAAYNEWHPFPFFFACLGIIPLAAWMGRATEHLADRVGEGLGGLLNATFGNAAELIIAFAALRAGYYDIVKASITGSIIGNVLLVLGASMLAGGLRFNMQTFNRTAATTSATLLALGAISLTVPATFHAATGAKGHANEDELALGISVILFITYICSLFFSLKTHKHLYTRPADAPDIDDEDQVRMLPEGAAAAAVTATAHEGWSIKRCVTVLIATTVFTAWLSEILVHHVQHAAQVVHMNPLFIGLIVIAIIGNAAEHSSAVLMALKDKMDLSIGIALGSSAQVALFVAPILVFLSFFFGPRPMDLNFSPFEVLAVIVSVLILSYVATDGECNWLEGVQLLAAYAILGMAFYFAV